MSKKTIFLGLVLVMSASFSFGVINELERVLYRGLSHVSVTAVMIASDAHPALVAVPMVGIVDIYCDDEFETCLQERCGCSDKLSRAGSWFVKAAVACAGAFLLTK
jgi:hypothetical protein